MLHHFPRKGFFVVTLAFLLLALVSGTFFLSRAAAATTLKSAAAATGRTFAAAVAASHLSDSRFVNLLDTEFSGLTPENEMKWDATEPSQNSFNFGSADAIVNHAQSQGMKIRGHTLVWHNQLPGWVSSISNGSTLLSVMRNHIANVAGHYKGKIAYWDVVNEALNEDGTHRSDIFQNEIGSSYIEEAFKAARAADPGAKLCYNDYNTDGINAKSTGVYNMVRDFKSRGIPIDCVGFQSHLSTGGVPSTYQANLQRFAQLGVDVNITELDIGGSNRTQQANDYKTVVSACMATSTCTSITTWGITDNYSWRSGDTPLLFDSNYQKKPAYDAVIQALSSGIIITPTPGMTPTPGQTPTPGMTPTPGVTPTPTTGTSGTCRVSYTANSWPGGFTANLTVTNTGTSTINGWTLKFSFPGSQQVTQGWNGVFSQSGNQVTITNASYNGTISPNGSVNPGFNGSWSGSNPNPTSFSLNGTTCTS